jgi:hypothetical protein
MVNYQDAKIYKLVGGGLIYYGSTCNELNKRLYQHKQKNNNCKSKLLFDSGDKVEIILVEKYLCNDKIELHQRERYYIENFECVNKYIPLRTQKEYRDDNKDKIKEWREVNKEELKDKKKEYYENNKDNIKDKINDYYKDNKDKIKERKKEYYEDNKDKIKDKIIKYQEDNKDKIKEWQNKKNICECGGLYTQSNKSIHNKTKKHIKFFNYK